MRILLFGRSGQLGSALSRRLAPLGQIIAPDRHVDFRNPSAVYHFVADQKPNVIVNAAAWTAVDDAEDNKSAVGLINTEAPAMLARAALECDALMVHYSTDYVFDGSGSRPWRETDTARPCNVYGASKLAADDAIKASGCRHLIFRCSWIYADQGSSFLQTMMQLAKERETLSVVDDQIGSPTHARLIADVTVHAMKLACSHPGKFDGIYHLAADGEASWFDYACHIFARMKQNGVDLSLRQVIPVSSTSYASRARRPLNSRLCTQKLQDTFQLSLPGWQADVDATVDRICTMITR